MAKKSPEQIAAKFQRRIQGATQDYQEGVQNPSRDWAEATQAGQKRWEAGLQQAMAEGKFARGVRAAGSAKWQQNAASKGAQRFSASAQDAAASYRQKAGQVMEAAERARQAANALPNTTFEERMARAHAAAKASRDYWRAQGGGSGAAG